MKTILYIIISMCIYSLPSFSQDFEIIYQEWFNDFKKLRDEPAAEEKEEQAIKQLAEILKNKIPDEEKRLRIIFEGIKNEKNHSQRMDKAYVVRSIWLKLASPETRAKVLSEMLINEEEIILGSAYFFMKVDVISLEKFNRFSEQELESLWGSKKERYMDVSHYASEGVTQSSRLAALLFSKAPGSALLDYSAAGQKKDIRKLVEKLQKLRYDSEERNKDTAEQWEKIQEVMLELLEKDDLAVDAYLARVAAWGRNKFRTQKCNQKIIDRLEGRDNAIINYLLKSNKPEDLLKMKSDAKAPFPLAQ